MHSEINSTSCPGKVPQDFVQPAAASKDFAQWTLLQADGFEGASLMATEAMDAPSLINPGSSAHQTDRLGRADRDAVQTSRASGGDDLRGQDERAGPTGIEK